MTRRFVHPLALLFTFSILMFPLSRLQAADCGCPKPKVKITEISYADPEVVKVFFDDEEVKPTDDPVEMERDKEYKLTIKDVDPDAAHQCQPAELKFPHCTIEYSTDGGGPNGNWTKGTSAHIRIFVDNSIPPVITYVPEAIAIRITGPPSDDAKGSSDAPGSKANTQSSPPEYKYDAQTATSTLTPPGIGLEIPMGAAMTPWGYRSAGLLVNYGPVGAAFAGPSGLRYNGIPEVSALVSQYFVQNGQGVATELHYIAPQGVLRVRGWNSSTQSPVDWQGAQETLVEVYIPENYVAASHTFSGEPHSYYRLEIASGNSLQPGLRLVQSNFEIVSTRTMQASGDGLTLRDSEGTRETVWQVIPAAQGTTRWERQITTTTNAVVGSSVLETYDLKDGKYVLISNAEDPSPAIGDELIITYTSYYSDGRVRSVSRADGSWSFYTYSGNSTTTYSPWLSLSSLTLSNGIYSLPTAGMGVRTVSSDSSTGGSSSSYLVDFSGAEWDVQMSGSYSSSYSDSAYTHTSRSTGRGDGYVNSYSLAYPDDYADRFLAGRTIMTWDATGRATLHQYERGNWAAPVFTPDTNGTCVRTSTSTGYIAAPSSSSTAADFTNVPSHGTKEVTITTALGVVREETHVCNAAGSYQLALAKDLEYESSGQFRPTGTKINGIYISQTEYVSPTVTRNWGEDGSMTETETDGEGDMVRSTTSGNATVPAVTTTYDHTGLTSTTAVNGLTVSVEIQDYIGRTVSSQDATGAVTMTAYADGGRTVTRTAPGGVITVESHHFDEQADSTTGTGIVPKYYGYSVDPDSYLIKTTSAVGSPTSARVASSTRFWDGSTASESSPDPEGGSEPIVLTYTYAPGSSSLVRVHSTAANTADRIQLDPATSAAAAMGHYSLSGSSTVLTGDPVVASTDRLTETSTSYILVGSVWNQQTVTRVFHTDGTTASYTRTSLQALAPVAVSDATYGSGLRWTSSTSNGTTILTSNRDFIFDVNGGATVQSTDDSATSVSPDSTSVSRYGRTISSSAFGTASPETMVYDSSGRMTRHTSATGANTDYGYNAVGQLESTTDHEGKATTYLYHPNNHPNSGLLWKTTNPESEVTETLYNNRGQLAETTGNGTYRVTRGYNAYGEMDSMITYRTAGSSGDLTQWNYNAATGLLDDKTDAASKKTLYTYYSNGRLKTRQWARPGTVTTTYTYNSFGDVTLTDYSETTPDVTVAPDRLGRPLFITDASGTRAQTYQSVTGDLDLVAYDSGVFSSLQIDYTQDSSLRPSGYSVSGGGPSSVLGYDSGGRLFTVAASGSTHTHAYTPGTHTLANLTTTSGATTILTRTLHHDRMQRLRGVVTANASGTPLSRHGYTLDDAGRRKTATRENGQRWIYGYDALGQVTSGVKKFPDEAPIPGYTFGYGYDGIGNRISATHGGTGTSVTYTPNALNQYSSVATQGGRFILGEAPAANAVTVNGLTAARAGGLGFYWQQITASNASAPVWSNDTVVSNSVTIAGNTWTPKNSVTPVYDEDGNLKSDGRWDYLWDAENRLIQMKASSAAYTAGVPRQQLDFAYDSQGRRISKTLSTWNGTVYAFTSNQRFLYDGWNLIAEYSAPSVNSTSLTLQATHTWGIDLSGTPQGAGGVGGLLCSSIINPQSQVDNCYPAYDGNGNISAWIDGNGTLLGRMDYSPFGQLIAQYKFTPTGNTTLSRLAFGFSTKYTDAESGLLYYGYRYYDPVNGRWPSRDPIEEKGGVNLYKFVNSIDKWDFLGLMSLPKTVQVKSCTVVVYGGHGYGLPFHLDRPEDPNWPNVPQVPINIYGPKNCTAAALVSCSASKWAYINSPIPDTYLPSWNVLQMNPVEPELSYCSILKDFVEKAKKHARTICSSGLCGKVKIEVYNNSGETCKSAGGANSYKGWVLDCKSGILKEGDK